MCHSCVARRSFLLSGAMGAGREAGAEVWGEGAGVGSVGGVCALRDFRVGRLFSRSVRERAWWGGGGRRSGSGSGRAARRSRRRTLGARTSVSAATCSRDCYPQATQRPPSRRSRARRIPSVCGVWCSCCLTHLRDLPLHCEWKCESTQSFLFFFLSLGFRVGTWSSFFFPSSSGYAFIDWSTRGVYLASSSCVSGGGCPSALRRDAAALISFFPSCISLSYTSMGTRCRSLRLSKPLDSRAQSQYDWTCNTTTNI
ncbi:hypothetical protein K438DRAFT_372240 [Mycena galopus ATCC 62051]|nr:hypothetical protein K438DRAFT_372240 [Mycena galopus ATCC 62051]